MLQSLKNIEGYGLKAIDGELGKTKDFYFDDASWTVRYAVVDTQKWLPGRRVLISPTSFKEPQWSQSMIPTSLTMDQVRESPSVETDRPVSRQHEAALAKHFAWPVYWIAPAGIPVPAAAANHPQATTATKEKPTATVEGSSHLRSLEEVVGYDVQALDGEVGSVSDFIVDTDAWNLRYLVADTRKWFPGGKVLLSLDWIESIDWKSKHVKVDLKEDMVKACPPYKPSNAVNREYEERIYDYYGRPRYWV